MNFFKRSLVFFPMVTSYYKFDFTIVDYFNMVFYKPLKFLIFIAYR